MIKVDDHIYKWLALATVGLGVLTSTLDGSIVNLAYPVLTEAFNTTPSTVLWVTVAYLLVSSSLALPLGTIGDIVGRKRLYILGFMVFTLGLGLSSISQTIGQLISFRILQGVGQAMLVATINALIVDAFPDKERGKALGINGALVGLGLSSGPFLGGIILDFLGWQALFWTRLPVSVIGLIIAIVILRPDVTQKEKKSFDYAGTVALMIGLSSLLLLINRAPIEGLSPLVTILAISSIIGLVAFPMIESKTTVPILELSLLKERLFTSSVTSSMLQFMAQGAFLFLISFYLLNALGLRPIEAGPVLMIVPMTRLICSPISGFLSDHFQSRTISTFGLSVMIAGYFILLTFTTESSMPHIITGLILSGSGSAIFLPPNNSVVMGSVSRDKLGMASAIIPTARQVGISIGIALIGTIYSLSETANRVALESQGIQESQITQLATMSGYKDGLSVSLAFLILAIAISAYRGKDRDKP
ncbi:MAG: MFS transporter [Dehalococcoidia bacterium]|nr:MFS transporter [Dehalococcoidia bacterium]